MYKITDAAARPQNASAENADALLTAAGAAFGYDGHMVVRDLDFTVNRKDYLCIVGENGSGKSTLVKGILRLIAPMQGSITFGAGITRNEIGYLCQQPAVKKDFPAGVYEVVLSGNSGAMGLRPFYTRKEKQAAAENMRRLGIADLRERCFRELSGGQQRRVLLARALCASRKLLVLDEPAAGLDPPGTAIVYNLLKKINQEMDVTIIMVSHDIEAAAEYSRKILHLKNKQYFFGDAAEYMQSDERRQLYARHSE
ncbi:MAG: metal ABC transporter ATP-binding protein [Spirochaetales bacterium]|jgi:zinc transport system ATP-binding protein|nr:metal ABC transporter ATP-binding protein [Spirochaetales bacterium]